MKNNSSSVVKKTSKSNKSNIFKKARTVPEGVAKSRLAICKNCEFLGAANMCKKCNCFMLLKTKLAGAGCPANKWMKFTVGVD